MKEGDRVSVELETTTQEGEVVSVQGNMIFVKFGEGQVTGVNKTRVREGWFSDIFKPFLSKLSF